MSYLSPYDYRQGYGRKHAATPTGGVADEVHELPANGGRDRSGSWKQCLPFAWVFSSSQLVQQNRKEWFSIGDFCIPSPATDALQILGKSQPIKNYNQEVKKNNVLTVSLGYGGVRNRVGRRGDYFQ